MKKLFNKITIIILVVIGVFAAAFILLKHLGIDLPGLEEEFEEDVIEETEVVEEPKPEKKSSKLFAKLRRNYTSIDVLE